MNRSEKIRNRRVPFEKRGTVLEARHFSASTNEAYDDLVEYMSPIDPEYTVETFAQADRVKNHLSQKLSNLHAVQFDYQGSVTSDTHIKVHSDIDLLTLNGIYTTFYAGYIVSNPVSNEVVVSDLRKLREDSAAVLNGAFPAVDVDTSGPKAIRLSGGSLQREVDVVFCNWWHTKEYVSTSDKKHLGIRLLNIESADRVGNLPFLHNWNIDLKDSLVNGGLRKVVRLLKGLKYDREPKAAMSSYDIASLAYNVPSDMLTVKPGQYLNLARNTQTFLRLVESDATLRSSLMVPNGTRTVFGNGSATLDGLKELRVELDNLLDQISATGAQMIQLEEALGSTKLASKWHEERSEAVKRMLRGQ